MSLGKKLGFLALAALGITGLVYLYRKNDEDKQKPTKDQDLGANPIQNPALVEHQSARRKTSSASARRKTSSASARRKTSSGATKRKTSSVAAKRKTSSASAKHKTSSVAPTPSQATNLVFSKAPPPRKKTKATKAKSEVKYKRSDVESENTPLALWTTFRAIFLKKQARKTGETPTKFLNRLFEEYAKDGLTREAIVGKTYAIATASLQKRGLLEKGSRTPTKKGQAWGTKYIKDVGMDTVHKRFVEFERILSLSKQ